MYWYLGQRTGIVSSFPLHIFRYSLTRTRFGIDKDNLIPISRADEKKVRSSWELSQVEIDILRIQARSMLRRELPARWRRELVHMLYLRRKAETEILSSLPRSPDE